MYHEFLTHDQCTVVNCPICEGGLGICVVCNAAEDELTKHCPGKYIEPYTRQKVAEGEIEYEYGWWFDPTSIREACDGYC